MTARDAGAARLVLVHGSPGNGGSWDRVRRCLRGERPVLAPDLPGHGEAAALPLDCTTMIADMAAGIVARIERDGRGCILVGHSFGGNVALAAALRGVPNLERLILLEPVLCQALALTGARSLYDEAEAFFFAYAERVAAGDDAAVADMIDFWFGAGTYAALPPPLQAFFRSAAAENERNARATFNEPLDGPALAALRVPVTVVHGGASPPIAARIAEALATLLPAAEATMLPRANHAMLDTHPAAIARIIEGRNGG